MKTELTLKQSSFLFIESLNLIKNTPVEVESDTLTNKEVKIVNKYINSGGVASSNGLLPVKEETTIGGNTTPSLSIDESSFLEKVEMKSEEVNIILPKEDQEVVDTNKEIELKSETSVSKKSTPKRTVKKK